MSTKEVYANNTDNYVVTATADGHEYTLDYVSKNPNQPHVGTSPTGLLLSSLAGCQLMTARSFFSRNNIKEENLELQISGNFQYTKEGWKLTADAVLNLDNPLTEKLEMDLTKFIDRFCTVSGVLEKGNEISLSFQYRTS